MKTLVTLCGDEACNPVERLEGLRPPSGLVLSYSCCHKPGWIASIVDLKVDLLIILPVRKGLTSLLGDNFMTFFTRSVGAILSPCSKLARLKWSKSLAKTTRVLRDAQLNQRFETG